LGDFPLNSAYEFAALNQTLWGLIIASLDASADDYDASTDDYENDDHDRAADVGRWSDQRHTFRSSKGGLPGSTLCVCATRPHGAARRRESALIDNLEWVDDAGGCHAPIKDTNERYWITPNRAGFHEWTWESSWGQRYTARAFWHGQKLWMAPRQSPSTTTLSRHRGKQRKSRQAQRGRSAAGGGMSVKHLCRYLRRSPPSPAASGHLLGSGHLLCPDPNHDPRYVILESPTCNLGERPRNWFVIGFHYVNDYRAAVRTQNTQRDFNNTGKSRGGTDSANAFGSVSHIRLEVFGPAKDTI
jgi:hypothetical protein